MILEISFITNITEGNRAKVSHLLGALKFWNQPYEGVLKSIKLVSISKESLHKGTSLPIEPQYFLK